MSGKPPVTPTWVGNGNATADDGTRPWTLDDTERWLTDYPLPATFKWNHQRAYPQYRIKKGYGFWLRTAGPYYPALRGLFGLCHEILSTLRPGIDPMPDGERLAALLEGWDRSKELPFTEADWVTIKPGATHPGENAPTLDAN